MRVRTVNRKLIVFVPPEALDAVRDAVFAAGAGRIGDYERCSWYTEGTGTFLRVRAPRRRSASAVARNGCRNCGWRRSIRPNAKPRSSGAPGRASVRRARFRPYPLA